jgi:hypothetical protein
MRIGCARFGVQVIAVVPEDYQSRFLHRGKYSRAVTEHRSHHTAPYREPPLVSGLWPEIRGNGDIGVRGQHIA